MITTTYKLYHLEYGYKCRVIYPELVFLFGIPEDMTPDAINDFIKSTGYYVTDL